VFPPGGFAMYLSDEYSAASKYENVAIVFARYPVATRL
jgi:hypothetical protein